MYRARRQARAASCTSACARCAARSLLSARRRRGRPPRCRASSLARESAVAEVERRRRVDERRLTASRSVPGRGCCWSCSAVRGVRAAPLPARDRGCSRCQHAASILDSVGDGIVTTDSDGCVIYANPAAHAKWSRMASQLMGLRRSSAGPTRRCSRRSSDGAGTRGGRARLSLGPGRPSIADRLQSHAGLAWRPDRRARRSCSATCPSAPAPRGGPQAEHAAGSRAGRGRPTSSEAAPRLVPGRSAGHWGWEVGALVADRSLRAADAGKVVAACRDAGGDPPAASDHVRARPGPGRQCLGPGGAGVHPECRRTRCSRTRRCRAARVPHRAGRADRDRRQAASACSSTPTSRSTTATPTSRRR